MKILFISTDQNGSFYYRIFNPVRMLKRIGHEVDIATTNILKTKITECLNYDIIILQRYIAPDTSQELCYLREHNIKIYFEIDDYFFEMCPNSKWIINDKDNSLLKEILRFVDGIIVTTQELKNKYLQFNKNILVFNNYYFEDDLIFEVNKSNNLPIKICYAGGHNHRHDINGIKNIIYFLLYKYKSNIEFNFFGGEYTDIFQNNNIKYIGSTYKKQGQGFHGDLELINRGELCGSVIEYYKLLLSKQIDIAIVPLSNNNHNNCKSDVKFLEYGLFKIPIVASNKLVYNNVYNYDNGFIAENQQDWIKYISLLIEDIELRNIIAENNYNFVLSNYNIKNHINKYENFLNKG